MWWMLTTLALAGTLSLEADEPVRITVGPDAADAGAKTVAISGIAAGAYGVQVAREGEVLWAGELRLPSDDVDATLRWRKGGLTVEDVKVERSTASRVSRAANLASGIATGAQQASALADDASAARSDFDRAQRGELTESSRTEMTVEIGSDGVNSSSSRTTAGAGGVEHRSTSSRIGPDGSSLSTTEASLTSSGYVERSEDRSLKVAAGDRGDVVLIGGPVAPGEALAEADRAPDTPPPAPPPEPPPVELPKEQLYREPSPITSGELTATLLGPIATAEVFKVAIKLENGGSTPMTFSMASATFTIDGKARSPGGRKAGDLVVIAPGDSKRRTFAVDEVLGTEAGYRVPTIDLTLDGLQAHAPRDPSGAADQPLGAEAVHGGGADCSLAKFKAKKGTLAASWKCTATGAPVFVDLAALTVAHGGETSGGAGDDALLLVQGDDTRIDATWELAGSVAKAAPETLAVSWSAAIRSAEATDLAPIAVTLDAVRAD